MTYFNVVRSSNGFVAVWPTKSNIYFARMNEHGGLQPPIEIKTPGTTGMRTGMLALNDTEGNTLIVWKDLGKLMWQLYDRDGVASSETGSVDSSGNAIAGTADRQGNFVLFP
jgi:hypothetical protein